MSSVEKDRVWIGQHMAELRRVEQIMEEKAELALHRDVHIRDVIEPLAAVRDAVLQATSDIERLQPRD